MPWLALAVLAAGAEASTVRGVAPSDQSKYAAPFRCFNGGSELPSEAINDDFCDCEDGSDEPGTGACSGQQTTLFYCPNDLSDAAFVYASRVNDGICDCCDGSDEWLAAQASGSRRWPHAACSNTCAVEGRTRRRERDQQLADLRSGISQRQKLIESARQDRLKSNDDLVKLRETLPRLESLVKQAKRSLDEAQKAVDEMKARQEMNSSNTSISSNDTADFDATKSQAAFDEKLEKSESEKPQAAVSEYSKWMDGAEEVLPSEASEPVVSEYSKWMDGAEEVLDSKSTLQEFEEEVLADMKPGIWKRLQQSWQKLRSWVFGERIPPEEQTLSNAQEKHRDLERKFKDTQTQVSELEQKIGSSDDEESLAYSGLEGRCIDKKIGEYKYEICFFKQAKQDSTKIGGWKGWEGPGVANFDEGSMCPGGPARSLKVRFRCGGREELVGISEPSRCTYEADLRHPAACTEVLLYALEQQGPRMPKDEL